MYFPAHSLTGVFVPGRAHNLILKFQAQTFMALLHVSFQNFSSEIWTHLEKIWS